MWARRLMIETGTTPEHLAAVVMAQREYAMQNERAMRRKPISLDDYMSAPFVVEPFRAADCSIEVDGGCAVLVTSLESARELRHPPAVIRGGAWATGASPGLDGSDIVGWPDMSRNFTHVLADDLWRSAGLQPSDMDFAQIYDCFSTTPLYGLEGLGLVERGEAGPFVAAGETRMGGRLPVNTNGGLLAEGYLQGMNTVAEAVLQIQGRSGTRQLARAERGVVTSGAQADGSALVLERDAA
jgi:acetyl-CoA acetyltransferase